MSDGIPQVSQKHGSRVETLTFGLRPLPPFRLDLTVWALRRRARNLMDQWDGTTYRRVVKIKGRLFRVAVNQVGSSEHARLRVVVSGRHIGDDLRYKVRAFLVRTLGLGQELSSFYALAASDQRLGPVVARFRGVKPPRFPSIFEALINAIACQQLSLTVGIELLNRLSLRSGQTPASLEPAQHAFPGPEDVMRLTARTLRSLGFSYSKAHSMLAISEELMEGHLDAQRLEHSDDDTAIERLMRLRGVGRWTAEYVLLRGLGRANIFPGDDVGAQNRLAAWLGRDQPLDYEGVKRAVRRWQPYAGLVYFHLLLTGLEESGEFNAPVQSSGEATVGATKKSA
jgi:DNA-3-methyladenine glycosylase II